MERGAFTTFAYLAERAACHPNIIRRNQMHKAAYISTRGIGPRGSGLGRASPSPNRVSQSMSSDSHRQAADQRQRACRIVSDVVGW